jgi:serine protease Do
MDTMHSTARPGRSLPGRSMRAFAAASLLGLAAARAAAADVTIARAQDPLRQASGSIEALVRRVSASVVQVLVTGYRPVTDGDGRTDVALGRGRVIGSGTVVSADGFIVTNAHVVAGAERLEIVLADPGEGPPRLGSASTRTLEAALVGISDDLDLALLKVDAALPPLAMAGAAARQGELVFAFGSPDGLRNSVTMGMVSAVARQVDPESPLVYVQTDAAINPGNSGGPLVNVNGELIGINTFIRSASGGSEGLGFALPGAIVASAWPQLREFGHLHRAALGLIVQSVTPQIARGLSLPPDAQLVIADVAPGSPAARTGLAPGDTIQAIDGRPVASLTLQDLHLLLYGLRDGQAVALAARRGEAAFTVTVTAVAVPHVCERRTLVDPGAAVIDALGILAAPLDAVSAAALPGLRAPSGVLVTAQVESTRAPRGLLARGDVIYAVNGRPVATPAALREAIDRAPDPTALVLQVERSGQLSFIAVDRTGP